MSAAAAAAAATMPAQAASGQKLMASVKKEKNQHIQVVVRCRPLSSKEKTEGCYNIVDINTDRREVNIKDRTLPTAPVKTFSYDKVFTGASKQIELYKAVVLPVLEEVLLGYNCTIFAYGQTGTGKTFTMEGERTDDTSISWEDDPLVGIIPRAMSQLFSRLQKQGCEFTVRVSFLEIYNEELTDLLGADSVENPRLKIYEDNLRKGACIIQGLEEVVVNSKDQVYEMLQQGAAKRQTASTLLNAHSSRSHTLFMVTVHIKENTCDGEELLKTGKLNLVDLAGSECIGRSGAVDKRAREAGNINQSLLTLGRVITALVEHAPHVPYRESKLTRLLQDSLGGRTKTSIIATISPASSNLDETLSTLDYAFRARNITNKPEINQKLTKKALLREYTEEIERMRRDLQAARDKNGIYLAEENYLAMQSQLAQQHDTIKEMEEKISFTTSEMMKLSDLFSDTKRELEETSKELEVTGKKLEKTTDNLRVTTGNLCKMTQDRDEQKHLVGVHVNTETNLHSQATQLLKTADSSTSDVSGLHAKLDRKRNVESHNASVQEKFCVRFHDGVDDLSSRMKNFVAQQEQFSSSLCGSFDSFVTKRAEEVEQLSAMLTSTTSLVHSDLNDIDEAQKSTGQELVTDINRLLEHCSQTKETRLSQIDTFKQETLFANMKAIRSFLDKQTVDLVQLQTRLHSQMLEQQSLVGRLVDQQLHSIQLLRELGSSFTDKVSHLLHEHDEHNQQFLASQKTANEDRAKVFMESVKNALKQLMETQENDLSSHTHQMSGKVKEMHEKVSGYKGDVEQSLTSLSGAEEATRNELEACSAEQCASLQAAASDLLQTVDVTGDSVNAFSLHVTDFCDEMQQSWQSHTETVTSSLAAQKQAATDSLQKYTAATQALRSRVESSIASADSRLRMDHSLVESTIQDQCTYITNTVSSFTESVQQMSDKLQLHSNDVGHFLAAELKQDVPTGTTPQRREFEYPRVLSKTSPHDKIVEEFRKKYIEQEAVETALPCDSDSDEDTVDKRSLSQPVFDGDDVPVIEVEGLVESSEGRLNLSGDSAISSTSVVSSASTFEPPADIMSLKEDKENLMKKPSRIPAKAVKSSSVTSNIRAPLSSNKSKPLTRSCSNQSLDK